MGLCALLCVVSVVFSMGAILSCFWSLFLFNVYCHQDGATQRCRSLLVVVTKQTDRPEEEGGGEEFAPKNLRENL